MALVTEIKLIPKERQDVHKPVECSASVVHGDDGKKFVQLDTFGSADRKIKGKVSQSIQFSEAAAAQLKKLIEQTFPHLA